MKYPQATHKISKTSSKVVDSHEMMAETFP